MNKLGHFFLKITKAVLIILSILFKGHFPNLVDSVFKN